MCRTCFWPVAVIGSDAGAAVGSSAMAVTIGTSSAMIIPMAMTMDRMRFRARMLFLRWIILIPPNSNSSLIIHNKRPPDNAEGLVFLYGVRDLRFAIPVEVDEATRLGIYVQNDSRGGVMVTGVKSGTPGEKCRMQTNSSNASNDINNNEQWSAPIYYLVKGDRIIYVNNIRIQNETHYRQVIRDADTQVTLTVIDYKTGRTCKLKTDLLPPGSTIRLGIYVQNDSRGGVMVTGVKSGTPGTKCRMLK